LNPKQDNSSANCEIWVICENNASGTLAAASFELLGKARSLARDRKAKLAAVLLGSNLRSLAAEFQGFGLDKLYLADNPMLSDFHDEVNAEIIADLAKKYRPEIILGAASVRGRALMPRLAVLLNTGLTADCTGLEIQAGTGKLLQTRPAFGGNLLATIFCETFPQMSTVRPHVFPKPEPDKAPPTPIEIIDYCGPSFPARKEVLKRIPFAESGASLADAEIIVAAGLGCGGPKGIEMLKQLANSLGGALAASRSVVDSGWLDYSHQVGQTGITVHPKIYIACGISGAIQHLVGMQDAEFIVAINRDPEAAIFSVADITICGDITEIIPALLSNLTPLKQSSSSPA